MTTINTYYGKSINWVGDHDPQCGQAVILWREESAYIVAPAGTSYPAGALSPHASVWPGVRGTPDTNPDRAWFHAQELARAYEAHMAAAMPWRERAAELRKIASLFPANDEATGRERCNRIADAMEGFADLTPAPARSAADELARRLASDACGDTYRLRWQRAAFEAAIGCLGWRIARLGPNEQWASPTSGLSLNPNTRLFRTSTPAWRWCEKVVAEAEAEANSYPHHNWLPAEYAHLWQPAC